MAHTVDILLMINGGHFKRLYCPKICCYAWAFLLCGPHLVCQIDLVHLMSYIVYWYEPSDLAYEISHLIWHMRFTAIWGNRSTVDPIVLPTREVNLLSKSTVKFREVPLISLERSLLWSPEP